MPRDASKFFGLQGKVPPGHIRSLQESAAKKGKPKPPKAKPNKHPQDESVECQRRVQKRGGKPPQTAPTNPMFHLQSDHLQIHSNGKKTGERLPTPPTIQSPENERRVVRRNHTSLPNSSPLDDNLFNTPTRRSPRLHRSSIQRNLEPEYEDPHSPPRTHGHRPVQPAVDNEIHHHLVQVRDSRTSASRRLSNQSQSNGLRRSASQPSQRSQQNALRNSASQLALGSQRQNSHGIDSTPEISNRSRLASNSPVPNNEEVCAANNPEQEGQPLRKKRGPTTNLAVGKRGKNKVDVDIFEKDICGIFRAECVNSIGSWVRQRDNCPLQYDTFDELPERNVDRVIQNVRDHFILKPDDDEAVEAIKKVMRAAYSRHIYQIHLEYLELVKKLGSHEAALAQPPSYCSNKHDWTHMCGYFKSPAFKKLSERGRKSAAARKINHSSGNKSHTSVKYDLVRKGKPCDPCSVFIKTHNSGQMNDLCKQIKKKMEDLKKASDKGEINDTPEEIYYKCRNADGEYSGKRRRKAPQTHYSLYQQKEEETTKLKERLALVEKENKLLKKQKVTKESLNAYFLKNGLPLMELSLEDDAEDDNEDVDMLGGRSHELEDFSEDDQEQESGREEDDQEHGREEEDDQEQESGREEDEDEEEVDEELMADD